MNTVMYKEFKPTILFLVKFIALYLAGNLLYGAYVTHFTPEVDPATHWVSQNATAIISLSGLPVSCENFDHHPTTLILENGKTILSVYEGCNGINIMVIFISFLLAFGPMRKTLVWFIPTGLLIIYLFNQLRILLLFVIARNHSKLMYFTHKYVLTTMLFAVIFVLWIWWIKKYAKRQAA